jgi:DNA-binding SARP family transcriptional activator/Tfp pilus assembly protein PilF
MDFRVLGPLAATCDGRPVILHGPRQHRLLAVLLLNANLVVSAERLVDELWDDPPATARRQVHNAMAALRRSLGSYGDVPIDTTDVGYRLAIRPEQLDVEVFRRHVHEAGRHAADGEVGDAVGSLTQALALWSGPALPGLDGPLIRSAVAGLEELRLACLERLGALRLELGDAAGVLSDLTTWVAEHPLRESLRGSLMLALYRCGRQAEALDAYEQGRRLLAEELGLDPGAALRRLHEQILLDAVPLPTAISAAPSEPATQVQPGGGVACTLPHDIVDFSGRAAELAQLRDGIARSAATALAISTIDGMGGIGKTALAVRLAYLVRGDYPDGQHFLDLRGFTPGQDPMTSAQALDVLLRGIGVPVEQVPADEDSRIAYWRSQMASRRMLVVLDNAVDEGQVRPLLPGAAKTLVIVTSRRYLGGLEGTSPLFLDVLPRPDALALFEQVAGRPLAEPDRAVAAEVVELCGRLPLAVRIAGSRLRHRPNWTVADLVSRLRDQRRRTRFLAIGDRTVAAVLALSYRYLSPAQQRLFRLLGVHPGVDFEPYAVAALTGITPEEAEDGLDALVDENLLLQGIGGRYRIHDLVRDCAHELANQHDSTAELRAAAHRLLDYYLRLAWRSCEPMARAAHRFQPGFLDPAPELAAGTDPIGLLKVEHGNLVEAARYAAEHGWLDHTWQIPGALQPFLNRMNHHGNSLAMFERGLAAARELGDVPGESAMLSNIALIMRELGRFAEAQRLFEQAIAISRRTAALAAEACQLAGLGFTYRRAGQLRLAHETFAARREQAERAGVRGGYAALTNNLAVVCIATGRYAEARAYLEEVLPIARELGAVHDEAMLLGNLGQALDRLGQGAAALERFDRALELSRRVELRQGEAMGLAGRGAARVNLGDLAGGLADGRAGLVIARDAGAPYAECEALLVIGAAQAAAGQRTQAESAYEQARKIAAANDLPIQEARGCDALSRLRARAGDRAAAGRHRERALRLYPAEAVEARLLRAVTEPTQPTPMAVDQDESMIDTERIAHGYTIVPARSGNRT